jgi:hypothetical protein
MYGVETLSREYDLTHSASLNAHHAVSHASAKYSPDPRDHSINSPPELREHSTGPGNGAFTLVPKELDQSAQRLDYGSIYSCTLKSNIEESDLCEPFLYPCPQLHEMIDVVHLPSLLALPLTDPIRVRTIILVFPWCRYK